MKAKRLAERFRSYKWGFLTALFLLVAALLLLLLPLFGEPLLTLRGILGRQERTFSSRAILQDIVDVFELQTVEQVYRTVFPHDFYPEELSLDGIFDLLAEGEGSPSELLTPREEAYLRAYNLAYETGLARDASQTEFVVVGARIRAGYELSALGELEEIFRLEPPDAPPEESRITVSLPPAEVIEVIIEDIRADRYPYPAARVDAREWSAISSFVGEQARHRTVEAGILRRAEENARELLRQLLQEAGFAEIRFESPHG